MIIFRPPFQVITLFNFAAVPTRLMAAFWLYFALMLKVGNGALRKFSRSPLLYLRELKMRLVLTVYLKLNYSSKGGRVVILYQMF